MKFKKIFIFIAICLFMITFTITNVFAEGEETVEEAKSWGDTILDYVPVLIEGIIAFTGTVVALKLSTKKVAISLDELGTAKDSFKTLTNKTKELANQLKKYNDEFERYAKIIANMEENQKKIINVLKTMVINDTNLIGNGTAIDVVKELEGDEVNGEEKTDDKAETNIE